MRHCGTPVVELVLPVVRQASIIPEQPKAFAYWCKVCGAVKGITESKWNCPDKKNQVKSKPKKVNKVTVVKMDLEEDEDS